MNPFIDLFPDPDEEQQSKFNVGSFNRGIFTLPDFYPVSFLGSRLNAESLLFTEDGLKDSGKLAELQAFSQLPDTSLFKIPEDIDPVWTIYGEEEKFSEQTSAPVEVVSDEEMEDIWLDPEATKSVEKPSYYTWDSFIKSEENNPTTPFLTEAGSKVFDAALEYHQNDIYSPDQAGTVIRNDVFLVCLLHLGLGRSSVLFHYDKEKNCSVPARDRLRVSGCSASAIGSIVKLFSQCGQNMRYLERFAKRVYRERGSTPTRIAVAECIMTVLYSLRTRLSIPASSIRSLIHMESLFREPNIILSCFHRIILEIKNIKEDSKLLSRLFYVIQRLQYTGGSDWLRPILMEVMSRVSKAWLEFVERWVGLSGELSSGMSSLDFNKFFVGTEEDTAIDDKGDKRIEMHYILDKSKIPTFMTVEDSETMFECGRSLRFLQRFHPGHPLCIPGFSGIKPMKLEWKFSWEDLEGIHKAAREYEGALQRAIAKYRGAQEQSAAPHKPMNIDSTSRNRESEGFSASDEVKDIKSFLTTTLSAMSAPLPPLDNPQDSDPLHKVILRTGRSSSSADDQHLITFAPPMGITPLLSFSQTLSVQSRLVNAACLRMFFQEHKIRDHFSLLYRFQLLGDGVFKSRLTHALFDKEIDATERGKSGTYRTGGTMGLKLGARDSWPPASSELRLALMGILSEAYHGSRLSLKRRGEGNLQYSRSDTFIGNDNDIPGNMSFSIRELSTEEYQMCLDPNSISALDFLKIYYRPPSPLNAVITKTSMHHYDRIFKFLLRLLRMNYLVNSLWREYTLRRPSHFLNRKEDIDREAQVITQKFLVDGHHFVISLSSYVYDIGVKYNWSAFSTKLDEIAGACKKENDEQLHQESLSRLRAYHDKVLDRIMFAILLRKRQEPVMKLVETIFTTLLDFAKLLNQGIYNADIEEVKSLYVTFRRKAKTFIDVVRGLSEKKGYGDGRVTEDGGVKRGEADTLFKETTTGGYREEGILLGMLVARLEVDAMSGGVGYYGRSSMERAETEMPPEKEERGRKK